MEPHSLRGRLLVANPAMPDANFHRTVVLLVEHNEGGALGVVLNRPTEMPVDEPLPAWASRATEPAVLFAGGPVDPNAAVCLADVGETEVDSEAWHEVREGLGTLDLSVADEDLPPDILGVRIFAGYAGWAPGQLESEVEAGAWFLAEACRDDAFGPEPASLWRTVLRRQGGSLSALAAFPADPAVN